LKFLGNNDDGTKAFIDKENRLKQKGKI